MSGQIVDYEVKENDNVISVTAKSYRYFLNGKRKFISEKKFDDIYAYNDLRKFEYTLINDEAKCNLESELCHKYDESVYKRNPSIEYLFDTVIILLPSSYLSFFVKPLFEYYRKKENIKMVLVLCRDDLYQFTNLSKDWSIEFFKTEKGLVDYICEKYSSKGVL